MYKKHLRTLIITVVLLGIIAGSLFALGSKEADANATLVRITNVFTLDDTLAFSVKDEQGFESFLAVSPFTESAFNPSELAVGDYIEVVLMDGSYIQSIRYVNPIVERNRIPLADSSSGLSLQDRFSYAYGYQMMQMFAYQGLLFDPNYWARGSFDGLHDLTTEDEIGFYEFTDLFDIIEEFQTEMWDQDLAPTSYSEVMDLDKVKALSPSDDLLKKFSYTYGYLLVSDLLNQGIDPNSELYAQGGLDFAAGVEPLLDEFAMQSTFYEYQAILEEQYRASMAEVASHNLEEAESFLTVNATRSGIITTGSGLQYTVLEEGNGPKPTVNDVVEVHYTLYSLNGQILESSYDYGESAHFPAGNLIDGFTEALLSMNVGSKVRTWIHPALGYGEYGNEMIEPNALLIFEIELLGIDE